MCGSAWRSSPTPGRARPRRTAWGSFARGAWATTRTGAGRSSAAAGAVSVGWSDYLGKLIKDLTGWQIPDVITSGPFEGGIINLPAVFLVSMCAMLLIRGASESAKVNTVMVLIKLGVLVPHGVLTADPLPSPDRLLGNLAAVIDSFAEREGYDLKRIALLGTDYTWRIDDRQSLVGTVDYYPRLDNWGQFRVRARAAEDRRRPTRAGGWSRRSGP